MDIRIRWILPQCSTAFQGCEKSIVATNASETSRTVCLPWAEDGSLYDVTLKGKTRARVPGATGIRRFLWI